jgi:hypothetical protein
MGFLDNNDGDDAVVLAEVITALKRLSPESRRRVIETVGTFFAEKPALFDFFGQGRAPAAESTRPAFSEAKPITAKQFLLDKEPKTDVERVACLAFYLTHYAETPHFKTLDLSKLNTDAAQPKFSNAAVAVENATKMGYLVPAIKAHKQLSGAGERFVQALPNRDEAKAAMSSMRSRMRRRSSGKKAEEA